VRRAKNLLQKSLSLAQFSASLFSRREIDSERREKREKMLFNQKVSLQYVNICVALFGRIIFAELLSLAVTLSPLA